MKQTIFILLVLLLPFSCKKSEVRKALAGTWYIEDFTVFDEQIIEETNSIVEISVNLISLNEDETCILPVLLSRWNKDDKSGTWTFQKEGNSYLINFNTSNILFKGDFLIESLQIVERKGGHFYVMTLSNQLCVIELNRPVY